VRLQKFLASCGLGSRRACEQLIARGGVRVDGATVTQQGVTIDPDRQHVTVDGRPVRPDPPCYLALNKPVGILCTSSDPEGRDTFHRLLPPGLPRVFSVGRLDRDSEGLLLLTNDGDWANRLLHPRHHVLKTYHVLTPGPLTVVQTQRCLEGVLDEGELLRVVSIERAGPSKQGTRYTVVLGEGRNRHIRRLFAALGVRVLRLRRVQIGNLRLGALPRGASRPLTAREVRLLDPARQA
jgi:23S rRNA pseudouridine2605 synthase